MRCVEVTNWVGRAALSIMLIGCVGDATEPNEKNFAAALNTSLEKEGAFCLPLQFPVALNSGDLVVNSDRRKQMQALESVGLVHATEYELEERSVFGGTRSAKLPRYDLTPAGAEYRGQGGRGADQAVSGLCYGKPRLHRIVSWEGAAPGRRLDGGPGSLHLLDRGPRAVGERCRRAGGVSALEGTCARRWHVREACSAATDQ